MGTRWVLLYSFAVLLLCDYGMFSTSSPTPPSWSVTKTSNVSQSNTSLTTAESTTVGNVFDFENGPPESSGSPDVSTTPFDENYDNYENDETVKNTTTPIPSTTPPERTTRHKATPPSTLNGHTEAKSNDAGRAAGIVILVIILILIFLLLGVLYFLRKKGRSYSFDLNSVSALANDYSTPLRSDQQGVRYEQTNKDMPVSLDFIQEDKSEEKDSPMANGCAGEKTEQTPAGENEEDQNVPEENSFSSTSSFTPPMTKVEFNLDLDLIGGDSDLNNPNTSEAPDTPQNENNNNVTNSGRETPEETFTEISLDEHK